MLYATITHRNNDSMVLANPSDITIESCEWGIMGGPISASLSIRQPDINAMQAMLGGIVTITSSNAGAIWWGFVYSIDFGVGSTLITLSLEKLVNRAMVTYTESGTSGRTQAQTSWNEAFDSIERYGVKELIYTMSDASSAMATVQRDIIIATSMNPRPSLNFDGGNSGTAKLTCYGEWKTLDWQYYGNDSTGTSDSVQQIIDILNYSQRAVRVVNNGVTGITATDFKKSTTTALKHVTNLAALGDVNGNKIVIKYLQDRTVFIDSIKDMGHIIDTYGRVSSAGSISITEDRPVYGIKATLTGFPNGVGIGKVDIVGSKLSNGKRSPIIGSTDTPYDLNTIGVG